MRVRLGGALISIRHALARFVQTVQTGMSILARDGASRAELEAVAHIAMLGWDARTSDRDSARTESFTSVAMASAS